MKRNYYWLFIIIVALVVLRIPALFHPILDVDEAIYALFARIWFDGGVPYLDCVEKNPLGIYFFYGLIFSIFGKYNMIAVHVVTIAIVGITAYVIFLISSLIHSRRTGFWAALLYVVFTTTYIPKIIATTVEPIMLLPICLQFYWWIKFEHDQKWRLAFASGLAFATACCFKYQAGINLFVLLAYLIAVRRKVQLKDIGYFLGGAAIPPLIMIAYLYSINALDGFLLWNIRGNIEYISEGSSSIDLLQRILTRVLPYIASTALIWILASIRIYNVAAELALLRSVVPTFRSGSILPGLKAGTTVGKASFAATNNQEWLIVIWFLLSFVPVFAGHRFYGHYFLLLLPPMAILSSPVAANMWSDKLWLKRIIVLAIAIPAIGFTIARFFITEIHARVGEDNLENYKPLAAYVKGHTNEGDRLIAWGYAPLVYWYSHRMPAMRFFWSDLLTGRVPGLKGKALKDEAETYNPKMWEMFFADLERHKPVYIIDTTPANLHDYKDFPVTRYPRLMEYINGNYQEEAVINKVVFYRRIE